MKELIGRQVTMQDGVKKRGVIEYVDEQYIVVYWTFPRKERVVFPNNERIFDKVVLVDQEA